MCAMVIKKKRGFSIFFPSCIGEVLCLFRHLGVPLKSQSLIIIKYMRKELVTMKHIIEIKSLHNIHGIDYNY